MRPLEELPCPEPCLLGFINFEIPLCPSYCKKTLNRVLPPTIAARGAFLSRSQTHGYTPFNIETLLFRQFVLIIIFENSKETRSRSETSVFIFIFILCNYLSDYG